jgi:hypothetical protein
MKKEREKKESTMQSAQVKYLTTITFLFPPRSSDVEKQTIAQVTKNLPVFIALEVSLQCSHDHGADPYSELDESSTGPHHLLL